MNAHQRRTFKRKSRVVAFDIETLVPGFGLQAFMSDYLNTVSPREHSLLCVKPEGPPLRMLTGRANGLEPSFDFSYIRPAGDNLANVLRVLKERQHTPGVLMFGDMFDYTSLEAKIEAYLGDK